MDNHDKIYDLIIVGAGPAGLTAAIYASRRMLTTLVITKDIGGQAAMTNEIENYPGFEHIDGPTLMNTFQKQAEKNGAVFVYDGVTSIEQDEETKTYTVSTAGKTFQSHSVILAFGLEHRKLDVPGEAEYYGKGITYCATCDGPLFKKKDICVVGGGNSALDAIEYMSKLANNVHAFVRKDKFKGEQIMVDRVSAIPNVEIHFNTAITEVVGDKFVSKVKLIDTITNETSEMDLQGIFVEIGYVANTKLYGHLAETTEQGAIIIDKDCNTSRPGFFAAGDVTTLSYKQIITSGGEGCKAALTAFSYVNKKKGVEVSVKADRNMK